MFETPHRDFREDRVVIESDGAPSEPDDVSDVRRRRRGFSSADSEGLASPFDGRRFGASSPESPDADERRRRGRS